MSAEDFFIGIDLGTSNCALASTCATADTIAIIDIMQITQAGQLQALPSLPSVSYLPYAEEQASVAAILPWASETSPQDFVVGTWAKSRARDIPDRVITSAKSWLCNSQVDRHGEILPWQGSCEKKISPLTALQSYLSHLRHAYTYQQTSTGKAPLAWSSLPVVLTVPASFDEVARSLTHHAAVEAGLGTVTLLEEPLAAFYAWLAHKGDSWRREISVGEIILVCDVGGGTTDFSVIAVAEIDGNLSLERVSVGEHLLLGGDNMDLALAYVVKAKLAREQQQNLDHWQFLSLISNVRDAKEKLLNAKDPACDEVTLAIASKGSRLMAQTLSTSLTRREVEEVLLEGFFPLGSAADEPEDRRASGIQELGLPYERDAAITRHLARFLRRSRVSLEAKPELRNLADTTLDFLRPTAVLFNGGVFNATLLQERIIALLASWAPGQPLKVLASQHLDLAVAMGAAYFAKHKALGQGIRVHAGTGKSYYIGVESSMMAVPGMVPELKGLCILPQGSEEGSSFSLPQRRFGVVTGQQTKFRFFSSGQRMSDVVGSEVEDCSATLDETAELQITLPPLTAGKVGEVVPVELGTTITEVGVLQVYMQHVHSPQRWQVEFNVRTT